MPALRLYSRTHIWVDGANQCARWYCQIAVAKDETFVLASHRARDRDGARGTSTVVRHSCASLVDQQQQKQQTSVVAKSDPVRDNFKPSLLAATADHAGDCNVSAGALPNGAQ